MNLISESLQRRNSNALWLEFNPWQWGDGQAISRALFLQIAGKLSRTYSPSAVRRARLMRKYGSALQGSGTALKGSIETHQTKLLEWLAIIAAAGALGLQIPDWIQNLNWGSQDIIKWSLVSLALIAILGRVLVWLGRDHTTQPLDELRELLENKLRSLRAPLIVFVDDIDRLEAEHIRTMVRHVKANANLPNIIFVLLFQRNIVEAALESISGSDGRSYLDKIVQAYFDLPPPSKDDLQRVFTTDLQTLVGALAIPENGFSDTRWGNVLLAGILPMLTTLRDTRRLLSSIAIYMPLHQGPKAFEVNIIDMLGLEALRVFEPAVHAAICEQKSLMLQTSRFVSDGADDRNKKSIQLIVDLASPSRRSLVQDLMVELFPTISGLVTNYHFNDNWRSKWLIEKRVCTDRMFDRYFDLQIRQGTLSESDFQSFLDNSGNPDSIQASVRALKEARLLPSLAIRLDEDVSQLPIDRIDIILPTLFEIGNEMLAEFRQDTWNAAYISCWRAASWFLRRLSKQSERVQTLETALRTSDSLSVPATLISLDQEARHTGADREYLFDDDGFEKLKTLWVTRIEELSKDPDFLLNSNHFVSLLYRWSDFSGSLDAPRNFVMSKIHDRQTLVRIIARFVSISTVHSAGDRVSRKYEKFQRKPIEDFLGVDFLSKTIPTIDTIDLTPDQARVIRILSDHLAAWKTGQEPGDEDL